MADSNPWSADGWNLTAQAAYLKANGQDRAEARARDAGTTLGGKRPGGQQASGKQSKVTGNEHGGAVTSGDGATVVKYVILKKFYVPDNLLQPPSLTTVAAVQPKLGLNMAAKLYREYDIPNTQATLGFVTQATVTLELDIVKNSVAQLGFNTAASLTLEADLSPAPSMGYNMAVELFTEFLGVSLAAAPSLGLTMTTVLNLSRSVAAAPSLGINMAATLTRELNFAAVASTLGFGTAVTLTTSTATVFDKAMPWEQQIQFNTNTAVDVTSMTSLGTDASPATPVNAAAVVITKDYIYQIGGNNATPVFFNNIYAAPILSDGSLGSWASAGTIPVATSRMKVIMTKNRLVLIGGQINNGSDAFTTNCYSCPINSDGTLGSWVAEPSLNTSRGGYSVLVNHPYVYVFGGLHGGTSASIATCERALINDDGTLGAWSFTTSLPGSLTDSVAFDTGSKIYLVTGYNGTITATIFSATKNSDGTLGAWSSSAGAPKVAFFASGFATENEVFLMGGLGSGFAAVATVHSAPITAGVIGSWTSRTSMPNARSSFGLALTNSRLYAIGGFSGANSVTHAPFTGGLNDYTAKSFH